MVPGVHYMYNIPFLPCVDVSSSSSVRFIDFLSITLMQSMNKTVHVSAHSTVIQYMIVTNTNGFEN